MYLSNVKRRPPKRWIWQALNLLIALSMVLAAVGVGAPTALADKADPKVDPNLLALASEHPDFIFPVIVQKELKNKDLPDDEPEAAVEKANGKVNREKKMDFIASFSAELTGKEIEKLGKNPKVRWVSLDAPLFSTATGAGFYSDEFPAKTYNGSSGTVVWNTTWLEEADTGGTNPTKGRIQAISSSTKCFAVNCLRVDPDPSLPNVSIYRQVDLEDAALAVLSFFRRNEQNLIVNDVAGTQEEVNLQISPDGGANWTTLRTYSSTQNLGAAIDTFNIAAYASATTLIRFAVTNQQTGSRYLYIDNVMVTYATASDYRATVRANEVGLNGQGVTVAVVDSGINPHADLQANGVPSVLANASLLPNTTPADGYGHGTHVAGILAGKGNLNLSRMGVAPNANLINVKVSDDNGMSLGSDLVAGLQWVYDNRFTYNIKVVNISMNSTVAESYQLSPIDAACEILWFNGIVVVVSAGNAGAGAVYPPANDPFVITVGATDEMGTATLLDDSVAAFSAYGITEDGFAKPDLVAPGRNVLSLLAGTSASAYLNHPDNRFDFNYLRLSGTSMSAPVVSGAVALLLQDEPNLNPDQVKYRLMATANQQWAGYNSAAAGAGYLDVFAAVNSATTEAANQGIYPSQLLTTGTAPITWNSVGWNSVGWNSVGWNSVGWNSVGWNSVGWNSVGWNSVGWSSDYWGP